MSNTALQPITDPSAKMSSKEIADLMEKRHDNVMRDIKNLIDEKAIGHLSFEESSYLNSQNKEQPMYLLDFQATMTLVTGYDAKRRSIVIDRWMKLETGQAKPALAKPATLLPIDREFRAAVRMAKAAGLKGNQAVLSANRLTREMTGSAPLQLLEITHLESPTDQDPHLTPTDIGKAIGEGISGQKVNKALEEMGYQVSRRNGKKSKVWDATEAGSKYAVIKDTGKKHSDGTPVRQLFWKKPVVEKVMLMMVEGGAA